MPTLSNTWSPGFFFPSVIMSWKKSFSSVQSLSRVQLFATPWTTARQASLSTTNSWSPPKPMSIELVLPSNHLILCCPLLLLPSIFPRIRVFSNESALRIRWPKYWSFSFNISSSNEHPGLLSFRMIWLDLISSYLFSVAGWPMRKEQWLRARLSLSPSELPGSGGTSYSCDLLGPWESLNSSPFS